MAQRRARIGRGAPNASHELVANLDPRRDVEPLEAREQTPALALDPAGFSRGAFLPSSPRSPMTRCASSRCCPAVNPPAARCHRTSHSTRFWIGARKARPAA